MEVNANEVQKKESWNEESSQQCNVGNVVIIITSVNVQQEVATNMETMKFRNL